MITLKQPRGLTAAFTSGALTAAGAETVYDTTVTITFCINGKLYTKTAVTGGTTPTTDQVTGDAFNALAADKGCVFVWCLNASGTVSVAQGPVTAIDGTTDEFIAPDAPQFPFIADAYCPFAYQIVQTAGTSSAWTFSSSDWNATGVTDIIVDVATLPIRPPTDATA